MIDDKKEKRRPRISKDRLIVVCFCVLFAIVGIVLTAITGNSWWLTLLLSPFLALINKI